MIIILFIVMILVFVAVLRLMTHNDKDISYIRNSSCSRMLQGSEGPG